MPYSTGGGTDIASRLVAPKLAAVLKQTVVVVNKPGAEGIVRSEYVAHARPDGYTLLFNAGDGMVINPAIYENLPYDSLRDFAPITDIVTFPLFLIVKGDSPLKTIHDLVAYIKANPDKANYASASSVFWLTTELFLQRTGVKATRVPYKGAGGMALAVASGEVLFAIPTPPPVIGQTRSGAVRILATTAPKRLPAFPAIPTMAESGVSGVSVIDWSGMWAPAKTPPSIIATLNQAVREVLAMPEFHAQAKRLNLTVAGDTVAGFRAKIVSDMALWKGVAEKAHISIKL